jgi:hypothetical protein
MPQDKKGRAGKKISRGQVTVFVILGIVILAVVLFALASASFFTKLKLQAAAEQAVNSYLASESISYYVYTCMDAATTSAIDDLALQGGTFYDYQGGPYILTPDGLGRTYIPYSLTFRNINGEERTLNFNVSYSILNRSYCGIVDTRIPEYPYNTTTYLSALFGLYGDSKLNYACLYDYDEGYALSGFAGFNNLTRLCYRESPNLQPIGGSSGGSVLLSPCYTSSSMINAINARNRSAEYLLQDQISRRLKDCTNFSVFETIEGDNITVLGDPATKLTLKEEGVSVETTYNFSVKLRNKEPVLVKHSFRYESGLRIARLQNFVMSLLRAESQDFMYNSTKDYAGYPQNPSLSYALEKYFDPAAMSIRVVNFTGDGACAANPDCKHRYSHLIIFEDNASRIGNRSLTFITATGNRVPALDFLHYTTPDNYFDVIASTNQTIILDPYGYDPDDERVYYTYNDWKEDFDQECRIITGPPLSVECTKTAPAEGTPPVPAPHKWSTSEMYTETGRRANYTTNASDVGMHNVTITVKDVSGLYDYQVLKILVFDLPVANITTIRIYKDTPDNVASTEDELPLDGSTSTASLLGGPGSINNYIWTIYMLENGEWTPVPYTDVMPGTEPRTIVPNESKETNGLPGGPGGWDWNRLIKNMQGGSNPELNTPLALNNPVPHNVTLIVTSLISLLNPPQVVESLHAGKKIIVKECVPHYNETNNAPFPYNPQGAQGTNPFEATHTCCAGDAGVNGNPDTYQVREIDFVCFTKDLYGEFIKLKQEANTLRKADLLEGYQYEGTLAPQPETPPGKKNDVYRMEFERKCDGQRGNLCAGDMAADYTVAQSCPDRAPSAEAYCAGPASPGVFETQQPCTNYPPGTTFEKLFGGAAGGACETTFACSSLNLPGGYNSGGAVYCQATCDGSGGCTYAYTVSCYCDRSKCAAAQCDQTHTFEWLHDTTVCRYGCSAGCTFSGSRTLHCAAHADNPPQPEHCTSAADGYCYYNVGCSSSGGYETKGRFCNPGYVDPGLPNCCVRSTSTCGGTGICSDVDCAKPNICPNGQQPTCTLSGWSCQSAN